MLNVTFSNGKVFEIPAEVIAKHRAKYYAEKETDSAQEFEERFEEEVAYALEDDFALIDWASNNMDWEDVQDDAVQIRTEPVEKSEEWVNADKDIVKV